MSRKRALLEAIADKNRGLQATTAQKEAIQTAISQLELSNPHPRPVQRLDLLDGDWRLVYTTSRELLNIDRLPLAKLGNIYQCVRSKEAKIYNIAELDGLPYLAAIVCVSARFTPESSTRVQVKFERNITGFQGLIGYQSPAQLIDEIAAGQSYKYKAIDFQINSTRQGWVEITYLDRDLRIGRGNEGNVFVLTKV
ncbi:MULTISPECIES: PAP/fibrillin family protein [Planktothricoides]|uniref:PAP/fibrillin family protein n=2 Tax=Planktothricoides raciborskii TaxID=132608 RepID=A0AAU8JLQ1_9CYAN|nr:MULTISPECIES: PAP/fibrillin family protein [Planktothricoides]KOR35397.1 fibrillin [Planktothricoides sp. SR001]MBD2546009.1 PAP/fibrillin family protein [Planktothricoides raciborskii FACHB-1370]MBD2583346.1 PAP/fibrillin family protein [Planktothricoides raciborskii FACHB-1261]